MSKCQICNQPLHTGCTYCSVTCRVESQRRKSQELVDKVFGQWKVLSLLSTGKESKYLCECSCGAQKVQKRTTLTTGGTKRCRVCCDKSKMSQDAVPQWFVGRIKNEACTRGIDFLVNREQLESKLLEQNKKCVYTGWDIKIAETVSRHRKGDTTASVDRIDSSLPYAAGNIQWVHKDINWMKNKHSENYFLSLCEAVTNWRQHARSSKLPSLGQDP